MNYLVIKCGGSVLERLPVSFYEDIVKLKQSGEWQPIIVHGGGPLISSLLTKVGVDSPFVDGLRVTTNEVLDVVEMALSGAVNKQIVRKVTDANGQAYGISGVDGGMLTAAPAKNAEKLGFVGEIVDVNTNIIDNIVTQGYIPVISPLSLAKDGQRYNINADMAASAVAQALSGKLCFISDIPGIYVEEEGRKVTLKQVTKLELEAMIQEQVIKDGMIPKVQSAIDALAHGVPEVAIINGMEKNSLIHFTAGHQIGTNIVLEEEVRHV